MDKNSLHVVLPVLLGPDQSLSYIASKVMAFSPCCEFSIVPFLRNRRNFELTLERKDMLIVH